MNRPDYSRQVVYPPEIHARGLAIVRALAERAARRRRMFEMTEFLEKEQWLIERGRPHE